VVKKILHNLQILQGKRPRHWLSCHGTSSGEAGSPSSRLPLVKALPTMPSPRRPLDRVAQMADRKYCRPHARPFRLRFARVVAVLPVCSPATLQALRRPRPSTLAAVNLAPAVRHGCRSAGLACPLGSSTAAGSSVRHNQGFKARPHALNRLNQMREVPFVRKADDLALGESASTFWRSASLSCLSRSPPSSASYCSSVIQSTPSQSCCA
jgi:hypothetical protein